jgi:hypothetical protein
MSYHNGPKIVSETGLVFLWDGMNNKSWNGSSSTHTDLVGRGTGSFSGAGTLTRSNSHVLFTPNPTASTNTATVVFPSANITVPTGDVGSWSWWHNYTINASADAPNISKETGNSWTGLNGFVMGTGYATDGLRLGIGGVDYYLPNLSGRYYAYNVWENYCVTFEKNSSVKVYVNGSLVHTVSNPTQSIGSNSNGLYLGGTNARGGNWRGYMDIVAMWNKALTINEVKQNYDALKGRFGL